MYISVKPVNFTDEELEKLYNILSDEFDDLSEGLDDMQDNPYVPHDFDGIVGALNDIKAMMHKISDSGLFN
ncbi:MAG: hypothetical protein OSJ43_17110 [Oscillospiraceae bacterium]|nr:hypothetical protein [Oscillospiraceae bacterium]